MFPDMWFHNNAIFWQLLKRTVYRLHSSLSKLTFSYFFNIFLHRALWYKFAT